MTAEAIEDASGAFKKALIRQALSAELGHGRDRCVATAASGTENTGP